MMVMRARILLCGAGAGLVAALLGACAATPAPTAATGKSPAAASAVAAVEPTPARSLAVNSADAGAVEGLVVDELGVKLVGVRLSANGYVVDVRYRVFDPEKARPLLDRKVRPVMLDEATGRRFYVPQPPIVGSLRQTARNKVIHTDRNYFILFANPDKQLQPGSLVTLYVGNQKFDKLQVEAN